MVFGSAEKEVRPEEREGQRESTHLLPAEKLPGLDFANGSENSDDILRKSSARSPLREGGRTGGGMHIVGVMHTPVRGEMVSREKKEERRKRANVLVDASGGGGAVFCGRDAKRVPLSIQLLPEPRSGESLAESRSDDSL